MAADEVTRVVHRCEQASEDGKLDLSHCLLTSFPNAVFHLTRHATIESCDLSHNLLKKLSAKFASKFSHLKVLDLSSNKLGSLPEGLSQLADLHTLDASDNCLSEVPASILPGLQNLRKLNLQRNRISDLDRHSLQTAAANSSLEINLQENPLTNDSRTLLTEVAGTNITTSQPVDNYDSLDWIGPCCLVTGGLPSPDASGGPAMSDNSA